MLILGNRSVYHELKQLNDRIIQDGCKYHVIHNYIRNSMKAWSIDAEYLILNHSEFSSSTMKREFFSLFFDFVKIEYKELLHHVPTM